LPISQDQAAILKINTLIGIEIFNLNMGWLNERLNNTYNFSRYNVNFPNNNINNYKFL
jgi:hypothetical protein